MTRVLGSVSAALRRGRLRIIAAVGVVVFLVLAGTTAGYAYYRETTTITSTASGGSLAVTLTNLGFAYTFTNAAYDTVGSVTVTNASSGVDALTRSVTIALSATGDSAALSNIYFVAWSVSSTSSCATGYSKTGAKSWGTGASATVSLAPGASAIYCVESYAVSPASIGTADGSLTLTPTVTATETSGNWNAVATGTATQTTSNIFPTVTAPSTDYGFIRPNYTSYYYTYCLDEANGSTTSGTTVSAFGCKPSGAGNQAWKLVSAGTANGATYYYLQNKAAPALQAEPASTASGAGLLDNTATTATTQQWSLQSMATNEYQIVNRASGLCLTSVVGTAQNTGQFTTTACGNTAGQQYVISPYFSAASCTYNAGNDTAKLSWTTTNQGPFKVYIGTSTTPAVTTAAGATSATVTINGTGQALTVKDNTSGVASTFGDTTLATGTADSTANTCSLAGTT